MTAGEFERPRLLKNGKSLHRRRAIADNQIPRGGFETRARRNSSGHFFSPSFSAILIGVVLELTASCNVYENAYSARGSPMTIEDALKQHTDQLLSVPGVIGTAIGECAGTPCIKVFTAKKSTELLNKIPATLEGYSVVVDETGPIRPLNVNRHLR